MASNARSPSSSRATIENERCRSFETTARIVGLPSAITTVGRSSTKSISLFPIQVLHHQWTAYCKRSIAENGDQEGQGPRGTERYLYFNDRVELKLKGQMVKLKENAWTKRRGREIHHNLLHLSRWIVMSPNLTLVQLATRESRRDGTTCSPERECRVA